ncbi:MAG: serine/threonine-protein phosphatase [Clostridia bacterium]|nr:serine/threonine-protein phosphatase [Clostridia bacterium]
MGKAAQSVKDEITLRGAVISHIGCVRGNNEDNFYFNGDFMDFKEVNQGAAFRVDSIREHHLLCICDGMGGLEGGERAAGLAVQEIGKLDKPYSIQDISLQIDSFARDISEKIQQDANQKEGKNKEGTTMALAYLTGGTMHVANVGDSRVYVLRNGILNQVSMDQTQLYQRMLTGQLTREQLRKHPDSNKIDHYLGMPQDRISKDFVFHKNCSLCGNDRVFLCSDGISDLIPHEQMEHILYNNASPMDAARQMVEVALEMSGKDNATVIVVDVLGLHLPMATPASLAALTLLHENTATINTTQ